MDTVMRALGTPRRREILRLCWDQERSAGEIHAAFDDVTAGAISQHLSVLAQADLVAVRVAGRHRFYRARKETLGPLREWLEGMWSSALARLQLHAELEAARRGPRARSRRKPARTRSSSSSSSPSRPRTRRTRR